MAMAYRTPNVYVEEVSLFPPSVAEVETAVPAFIGYTEKAERDGEDLTLKPVRIGSLVEYQSLFGGGASIKPIVKLDEGNRITAVSVGDKKFYLYDILNLFFDNGGGKCYIISVGGYGGSPGLGDDKSGILGGLKALEKEDEPTIIVCPDAVSLGGDGLYDFQKQALNQCAALMDRVLICDLKNSGNLTNDVQEFRDKIGINNLKYGAAYVSWLKTGYTRRIPFRTLTLQRASTGASLDLENLTKDAGLKEYITGNLRRSIAAVDTAGKKIVSDNLTGNNKTLADQFAGLVDAYHSGVPYADANSFQTPLRNLYTLLRNILHGIVVATRDAITETPDFKLKADLDTFVQNHKLADVLQTLLFHHNAPIGFAAGKILDTSGTVLSETLTALNTITGKSVAVDDTNAPINAAYGAAADADAKGTLALNAAIEAFGSVQAAAGDILKTADGYEACFDSGLADKFALYKNIIAAVNNFLGEVPPSGAVAGVYATTDRTRGVWKAPANVSLNSVVGPSVRIDNKDQEELNVDANAGKSVNAIRFFSGKGTLVWGARTLAGNDNEWRYVPVRRFFNMAEESIKKSTAWVVFEPNDANTWIKVKSMIENYLLQKWREGALAGVKPEHAFFVNVGLGVTMTAQDILEGRMVVEIGLAVVRPAEFIILRFSHKMQQS